MKTVVVPSLHNAGVQAAGAAKCLQCPAYLVRVQQQAQLTLSPRGAAAGELGLLNTAGWHTGHTMDTCPSHVGSYLYTVANNHFSL